jgi:hypothetical protein
VPVHKRWVTWRLQSWTATALRPRDPIQAVLFGSATMPCTQFSFSYVVLAISLCEMILCQYMYTGVIVYVYMYVCEHGFCSYVQKYVLNRTMMTASQFRPPSSRWPQITPTWNDTGASDQSPDLGFRNEVLQGVIFNALFSAFETC